MLLLLVGTLPEMDLQLRLSCRVTFSFIPISIGFWSEEWGRAESSGKEAYSCLSVLPFFLSCLLEPGVDVRKWGQPFQPSLSPARWFTVGLRSFRAQVQTQAPPPAEVLCACFLICDSILKRICECSGHMKCRNSKWNILSALYTLLIYLFTFFLEVEHAFKNLCFHSFLYPQPCCHLSAYDHLFILNHCGQFFWFCIFSWIFQKIHQVGWGPIRCFWCAVLSTRYSS